MHPMESNMIGRPDDLPISRTGVVGVADARRSPGISSVTSDVIYRPCINFNEGESRRKEQTPILYGGLLQNPNDLIRSKKG